MPVPAADILGEFVDRTAEMQGFEKLLAADGRKIMCVYGPGGIGKSLLLGRMTAHCEKQNLASIFLEWRDTRLYNWLDIMRAIRDGTNTGLFQLFNDQVNKYYQPEYKVQIELTGGSIQNVEVLSDSEVRQSGVNVQIGNTIHDCNINVPRPEVREDEIIINLTDAFFPCLAAFAGQKPLVIFLDAFEKAKPNVRTLAWVCEEFLGRIRDRKLPNVMVVLSGREHVELGPDYFTSMRSFELKPFEEDHIIEYLERRGVDKSAHAFLSKYILANSQGNPRAIAQGVNNYLALMEQG